jgi:outer membrane protein TolC
MLVKNIIKTFGLFIIFFTVFSEAFAEDYNIYSLLEIAEKNSSNIKIADYQALSQKHFANQQKYWQNPVITINSSSNSQNGFGFSQTIPFFGKLKNKYNAEEAYFKAFEMNRINVALLVKAEVFSLIYQYKVLEKKIELTKKRLTRLSLIDKYLNAIILNSPTKRAQGRITKNKINLIERDLVIYENQALQTWNRINVYLNLETKPQNIYLEWLDKISYKGKKYFIEEALTNNLILKEQKFLIEKYKSESAFAKIEQMPDINLSISKQNNSSNSGIGKNSTITNFDASISIPLINRNQEKIIATDSKIKAQQYELEFKQSQIINGIISDANEYEISLKIAKNFPISAIDKSINFLNQANDDFKKGVLDFITYIELDAQEYNSINAALDAQSQLATSYANLMIAVGNFIIPKNEN